MNKKQMILFLIPLLTIASAFASHDTMFWIQGELFDSSTMTPANNVQMAVDIFTTPTCVGSPYWTGTFPSATDVNGVYSLLISNISMEFNQNYYACVYANSSLVNSAIQFRAGQGQVNEYDVDFTNLNITNDLNVGTDIYAGNDVNAQNLYLSGNAYLENMQEINWGSSYTLIYNNATNQFEFNDKVNIDGDLNVDGDAYAYNFYGDGSGLTNVTGSVAFKGLYYVSENGSDSTGDGTIGHPYKTYQAVLDNASEPMVNIMILDPENIADQNLTIYDYRGVSLFLPVGLAPYHYGEIDNLVMGNDSSFVGHSINIKDSITCGATSWSDIYMDNGGFVNELTITNPTNCIFWFAGTQLKPNTWKLIQSNGAVYDGYVNVRGVIAFAKGQAVFGNDNINFNYNGADKTLIYNTTSSQFEFNDRVYAPYFIGDGSQLTNISINATTINHTSLNNLNWSVAGHIMDDDMVFDTGKGIYLDNGMSNGLIYNLTAGGEMQWFGGEIHFMNTHLNLDDGYGIYFGDNGEFSINYDNDPNVNMTVFDDYNQRPAWIVNGITLGNHETLDDGTIYWDGKNLSTWQKYNFTSNQFEFNKNISAPYFIGDGSQLTNLPSSPQYWNRSAPTIYPANFGDDLTLQNGSIYLDKDYFIDWLGQDLTFNSTSDRFEFNGSVYANGNVTASNFLGNLNWSYIQNAPSFLLTETDPLWSGNSSTVARTGNCPAGQVVQNTTTSGVQCVVSSAGTTNHNALSNLTWDVAGHIINANVVPNTTNAYSLGNTSNYWSAFYSKNETIGNSTGNTTITPTGTTLYGTARVNKTIQNYAYNFYGLAGTYNGNGYSASAGATLGQTIFQNLLPTVTGGTVGSAFIFNFITPQDRVTGSNFTVIAHYQDGTTETCNIVMGIGERHSADGESYSQTDTWNEQTFAVPTTQYLKGSREFTFDGSAIENGNAVAITVYRNGEAGADTCGGSIYVSSLEIKYLSDKI